MRRVVGRQTSRYQLSRVSAPIATLAFCRKSHPSNCPLADATLSSSLLGHPMQAYHPFSQQRRHYGTDPQKHDESMYISGIRHVLSELPKNGLRLADFQHRLVAVLGEGKADPTQYGYASLIQALVAVNDNHYLVGDLVIPCDWERILMQVRAKLPTGGVLEPAFVRYINAEGCPLFKRGTPVSTKSDNEGKESPPTTEGDATATTQGEEGENGKKESPREKAIRFFAEQLKIDNPTNSSLPGVTLHEWVQTHFSRIIQTVDVTPAATAARAAQMGSFAPQTYIYKPVEEVHPYVQVLRTAFKCLGCTYPQRMPIAEPLQNIAAIVPMLPNNPKTNAPYTWPEFLQTPEVKEHFETKVSIFVAEQKATQTQIIFVDGTSLQPDEAEAAVHQWRHRRSVELGGIPVRVKVIAVRREDDPVHGFDDIIIDGYVVEPSHAIAARLALIADLKTLDTAAVEEISFDRPAHREGAQQRGTSSTAQGSGVDAGGWSAVPSSPSPAQPDASVAATPKTAISNALLNPEDETEAAVAAELATSSTSTPSTDAPSAKESSEDASLNILAVPSSLSEPVLPPICSPEVVVLVGSKDSKEEIDSGLADLNAQRHWVRTMLVIGEE